jgi:hypothetical protein
MWRLERLVREAKANMAPQRLILRGLRARRARPTSRTALRVLQKLFADIKITTPAGSPNAWSSHRCRRTPRLPSYMDHLSPEDKQAVKYFTAACLRFMLCASDRRRGSRAERR